MVEDPRSPARAKRLRELREKYGVGTAASNATAVHLPQVRCDASAETPADDEEEAPNTATGLDWTLLPAARHTDVVGGRGQAYVRLQAIGRGRFGEVYLCQERRTARLLVLKSVPRKNVDAPARTEARTLLKLRQHPNIIRLHDAFEGSDDGLERIVLVMDYADGGDLAQRIAKAKDDGTPLGLGEVLHVLVQVALALQHCHKHGVLHRDVKPANVFLTLQGIVRLGDFGIAKDFHCATALDEGGSFGVAGTPLYMAPEVLQGRTLGKPADVWSLGCIVFEMVALSPPFVASCLPSLVRKIVLSPTPELHTRAEGPTAEELGEFVSGLLEKDPEERTTLDAALSSPLCAPHVPRYSAKKLRRSLATETRLHELLDGWSVGGIGGRKSAAHGKRSIVSLDEPSAPPEGFAGAAAASCVASVASASAAVGGGPAAGSAAEGSAVGGEDAPTRVARLRRAPTAGIETLQLGLQSQRLQQSGNKLRAVVRWSRSARLSRLSRQSESERKGGLRSSRSRRSSKRSRTVRFRSVELEVAEAAEATEAAEVVEEKEATEAAEVAEAAKVAEIAKTGEVASAPKTATALNKTTAPLAAGEASGGGSAAREASALMKARRRSMIFSDASSSVLVRHLHAPEAVRAAASLRTYACSDGGRRAGQLWVSSAHVFFNAAGGSRVVIHIGRIRAIEMPRGWPVIPPRLPGGRRGRMLRFWLTPSGEGGKARREEFYGFTDRECVQRDILQQATAAGHTVAVIAGRLGCF